MPELIAQLWFPVTAMLAVLAALVFGLNQRSRQRRREANRPTLIVSSDHRDP